MGLISSIYSADGDYDIYGYYSLTKVKIMVVISQKIDDNKYDDTAIKRFLKEVYQIYQSQLLNPFG